MRGAPGMPRTQAKDAEAGFFYPHDDFYGFANRVERIVRDSGALPNVITINVRTVALQSFREGKSERDAALRCFEVLNVDQRY